MQRHEGRQRQHDETERFVITQRLGSGGMAVVYEAIDLGSRRRVALKVLRPAHTDPTPASCALEREAAAMTRAAGAAVCRVFGVSRYRGQPCLVMERLRGCTLETRLAAGAMSLPSTVDTAAAIASALETIHRAGVVHSDIKPANVFITEGGRIKILDFGLATTSDVAAGDRDARRSGNRHVLGTARYIAPERILCAPVDHRSDLFSLGAVIYEMAFGRSPFAAESATETLFNVLEGDPPRVGPLTSPAAVAVDRLARTLLEKNPVRRCQSAADVRDALARLATDRRRSARATRAHIFHTRRSHHVAVDAEFH
jgi:serine/threonine protein kinase